MLAQSRLLAMRKLSFRESGLMNQSAGTAEAQGRKATLESTDIFLLCCCFRFNTSFAGRNVTRDSLYCEMRSASGGFADV